MYWPLDNKFYPGSISKYEENTNKHKIAYDEGQTENLNMKKETWRILEANQVSISDTTSINDEALKKYFQPSRTKNSCCINRKYYPLIQYGMLTIVKN